MRMRWRTEEGSSQTAGDLATGKMAEQERRAKEGFLPGSLTREPADLAVKALSGERTLKAMIHQATF